MARSRKAALARRAKKLEAKVKKLEEIEALKARIAKAQKKLSSK